MKMALKPGPKGAIPTTRGWMHPRTGELLKSQRITQEQLDEYNGVQMIAEPAPVVEEEVHVYADDIEDEVQENLVPKPKSKKKSKKISLFG
jgi:hypothetical protein